LVFRKKSSAQIAQNNLFKFVFHPKAETEYIHAFRWYENQLIGLGHRFEKAFDEKLQAIQANPFLFAVKYNAFREARLKTFPYLIVYRIYPQKQVIFVSAVHHFKRNPKRKYRSFGASS
jgi:mRNA-degrading endonuclease RelE of RelBE toxin-antitoxin system